MGIGHDRMKMSPRFLFYIQEEKRWLKEEKIRKGECLKTGKVTGNQITSITVIELVEKYIALKDGVRYNTKVGYNYVLNLIKKDDLPDIYV